MGPNWIVVVLLLVYVDSFRLLNMVRMGSFRRGITLFMVKKKRQGPKRTMAERGNKLQSFQSVAKRDPSSWIHHEIREDLVAVQPSSAGRGGGGESHNDPRRLRYSILSKNRAAFLTAVAQRAEISNLPLDNSERKQVSDLIKVHLDSVTPSEYASLVSRLGAMENMDATPRSSSSSSNSSSRLGQSSLTKLLTSSLERHTIHLGSTDMVDVTLGFAKMRVNWNVLRSVTGLGFEMQLAKMLPKMNAKAVGDVIWALGSSNARWNNLPEALKKALLTALDQQCERLNAYALSSALWALAKMGTKWSSLEQATQVVLPSQLVKLRDSMSPQQSSKIVWALGSLEMPCSTLDTDTLRTLVHNVNKIKPSQMGSCVPSSQMLTGMAKLGIQWQGLEVDMQSCLWEQLVRVCGSTNERGIANVIWAMGTMGAHKAHGRRSVFEALTRGASRAARSCSAWSLSNIVWGLAKMGYEWSEMGDELREALMAAVARVEGEMNEVDVSVFLWSMGSMEAPLYALPDYFMDPLLREMLRNMGSMGAQELSSLIWGLSGCGVSWDMLPQDLRWNLNVALRRVGRSLSTQDTANCAYGLALLSFDATNPSDPAFRGTHEVLFNAVRKASRTLTGCPKELEQLRIFAQYVRLRRELLLDLKKDLKDGQSTPDEILTSGRQGELPAASTKNSALQERVTQGLRGGLQSAISGTGLDLRVVNEVSSFEGVFPCDAMVFQAGEVVAVVEIDGPQHYRDDGWLCRKDQLKQSMYMRKHPAALFKRIRWDEANRVGADNVGAEVAASILEHLDKRRNKSWGSGFADMFRQILKS